MQLYSQLHAGATEHTTSPSMARVSTPGMAPDTNGLDQNQSAAEIELMVKRYFVRLYSGELSAEKFVAVLHNCHDSQDQNQSEFFSCTVHTLVRVDTIFIIGEDADCYMYSLMRCDFSTSILMTSFE